MTTSRTLSMALLLVVGAGAGACTVTPIPIPLTDGGLTLEVRPHQTDATPADYLSGPYDTFTGWDAGVSGDAGSYPDGPDESDGGPGDGGPGEGGPTEGGPGEGGITEGGID